MAAPLALVSLTVLPAPDDFFDATPRWALLLCFTGLYRPAWPKPRRIDPGRLRTPADRRVLTLGSTVGFAIGFPIVSGLFHASSEPGDQGMLQHSLVFGLAFGLAIGLAIGLARGLMIKQERVGVVPRHLIRMDLTAAVVFGPVTAVGAMLVTELVSQLVFDMIYGPGSLEVDLSAALFSGLITGAFIFSIPVAGGPAALRYFALLLHTRRKLPWRLGRFLDACYELGILRVSGTAWQFRHRELQDHLATRPAPTPRS